MPPRRPSSRSILPNFLRRLAVTVVKPLVSKRLWQRLRSVFAQPKNPSAQQQRGQLLRNMNLGQLAAEFGSDKWGVHYYTPHYERHLAHLKKERFSLLEIGIGGYARQRKGGASLRMWKVFFPRAQILGLDLEDKSFVDRNRIRTYRGSRADADLLRRIAMTRIGSRSSSMMAAIGPSTFVRRSRSCFRSSMTAEPTP